MPASFPAHQEQLKFGSVAFMQVSQVLNEMHTGNPAFHRLLRVDGIRGIGEPGLGTISTTAWVAILDSLISTRWYS